MLTVLCPDTPLEAPDDRRWPGALRARLGRARPLGRHLDEQPIPALAPLEAWLGERFGLETGGLVSAAAYRRYAADAPLSRPADPDSEADVLTAVLTAVPAYFQAGMDHLVLHTGEDLAITCAEAEQLTGAANDFLAADGIRLSIVANDCWLLHLSTPLALHLRSSIQAARRNVHAYMPAGADGRKLRALLNELQMLWHEHPVNEARQAAGQPPINTLWVEGAAAPLPAERPAPFARVMSTDPVLLGLARAAGLDEASLSHGAATITAELALQTARQWAAEPVATLLHRPGPDNLDWLNTFLAHSRQPVKVVLTGEREWLELLCSPRDKLAFWRHTPLGTSSLAETEPARP